MVQVQAHLKEISASFAQRRMLEEGNNSAAVKQTTGLFLCCDSVSSLLIKIPAGAGRGRGGPLRPEQFAFCLLPVGKETFITG